MLDYNFYAIFKDKSEVGTQIIITKIIGWIPQDDHYVALVVYPPIDNKVNRHNLAYPVNSKIIRESLGNLQEIVSKEGIKNRIARLKLWQSGDTDNRHLTTYLLDEVDASD